MEAFRGTEYDTGLDQNLLAEIADYFRPQREAALESGLMNPKVLGVNIKTLLYQVPGGMLSNLVSQLKEQGKEDKFEEVQQLIYTRDTMYTALQAQADVAHEGTSDPNLIESTMEHAGVDEVTKMETDASKLWFTSLTAGAVVGLDKIIMLIALIVFRIGWWATIYCQQILLGMLTIFGPIQWAFSLLPKWEGAWAKWLTRYLTVHFYGAMLYFVGFYVLLLFDIVLCIQVENLEAITQSEQTMASYLQNSFFSAGYLMAASIVALKCLNLVPDLAAWMIPEGDTAFSTRNFGEGIAQQAKVSAQGMISRIM